MQAGSDTMRRQALAIAASSRGSTSRPWPMPPTISAGPPLRVATTGTPAAAASIRVRPNGSCSAGFTNTPPAAARR